MLEKIIHELIDDGFCVNNINDDKIYVWNTQTDDLAFTLSYDLNHDKYILTTYTWDNITANQQIVIHEPTESTLHQIIHDALAHKVGV